MSFCQDVKKELCSVGNDDVDLLAQAYGILLFGRSFSLMDISLLTENESVADVYSEMVRLLCGNAPRVNRTQSGKFSLRVDNSQDRNKIFVSLGYEGEVNKRINLSNFEPKAEEAGDERRFSTLAAFVRGAFLASGIITDPEKSYHLEFSVPTLRIGNDFLKLFDEFDGIEPKLSRRGQKNIIYLKKSSQIEDLLTLMGATEATLRLIEIKLRREFNGDANRQANFSARNIVASIDAAVRQAEAVDKIEKYSSLDNLPDALRETAILRRDHPTAPLSELSAMLSEPVSKSGICHRMKRLEEIAAAVSADK